ncbi:MAG: T9SS type A sorting domain-containing protein [Flavobacteriaceae bacterium]|nr:T9SS type A sorting domain-containing protein [Flavobacteriaceae bacterium]
MTTALLKQIAASFILLFSVILSAQNTIELDTSFNTGVGFNKSAGDIRTTLQPDGKILAEGSYFTSYNGTEGSQIVRLNEDGTLDTSFNIVGTGFNNILGHNHSIAVQSDGKILVGGRFTEYNGTSRNNILRLNADGTLDTSFDIGMGFTNNGTPNGVRISSISLQPDGKILVTGLFSAYNLTAIRHIARLNTDGTLDTSFNTVEAGFISVGRTIALQPDGKILVNGRFTTHIGTTQSRIVRLNADGTLDTSFNTVGTGLYNDGIFAVAMVFLQADGKILVTGRFTPYNGTTRDRIARLNANGTLDTSFNTVGTEFNGVVPGDNVSGIVLQPDGKILVTGYFTSYNGTTRNRIARLNADGTLDTSFNTVGTGFYIDSGFNSYLFDDWALSISLQSDGKILVGGQFTSYNGTTQNKIARLNSDGTLDTSFSSGSGFNSTTSASIATIALQPDGKILAGGNFKSYNEGNRRGIVRLNEDGTLDTSFNIGTGFNDVVNIITLQPDGKILVGGNFTSYNGTTQNRIARLNSDGTLDTSFNTGTGLESYYADSSNQPKVGAITLQPDGKILVGGLYFAKYNGSTIPGFVRLNTDGTLDTSFTLVVYSAPSTGVIAIQPNGKILVAGSLKPYHNSLTYSILRFNTDGTWDSSFSPPTTGMFNGYESINTISVQPDGKILAGGQFNSYNYPGVARLNADGTLEGFTGVGGNNQGYNVKTTTLQPDGKILVGGNFVSSFNGTTRRGIARLNTNAGQDTSFNIGTGFIRDFGNGVSHGIVHTIALQPDGKILVGGHFTSYNGTTTNHIVRLNDSSTLSIEDMQRSDIKLYPNPTQDFINLSGNVTIRNVVITDMSGRIILTNNYDNEDVKIDVFHLPKAVYLLTITTDKGKETRKIIKE